MTALPQPCCTGLKSSDPFSDPSININYFSDAADMATLKEGIRMSRKVLEQAPLHQ